jgi:transposase
MIHIGIDFHQRFMQVAVSHEDSSYDEARLLSRRETVREFFGRPDKPARVASESGYGWYWLVEELEMMGHEVHLSNPVQTKAIAHAEPPWVFRGAGKPRAVQLFGWSSFWVKSQCSAPLILDHFG